MNKDEAGKYISELSEVSDFFDRSAKKTMWIPKEFFDENKDYFGARAAGDGMTSAGINDGDLLIFEVGDTLEDGDIGMFFTEKNINLSAGFIRLTKVVRFICLVI